MIQYIDAYSPFALMVMNLLSGGGILNAIIGIVSGHLYYFVKDIMPLQNQLDLLKTPKYLVDYCERYVYAQPRATFQTIQNNGGGNNSNSSNHGQRNNFSQQHQRYVPFGGRGTRLD